jgi:hypothetical protein
MFILYKLLLLLQKLVSQSLPYALGAFIRKSTFFISTLKHFKIVCNYFSVLSCDSFSEISMGDRTNFRVISGILFGRVVFSTSELDLT